MNSGYPRSLYLTRISHITSYPVDHSGKILENKKTHDRLNTARNVKKAISTQMGT